MKGNRKYIAFLTVLVISYGLLEYYRPKPINWSVTLSNKDKIPFGTYATYELTKELFPGKKVISSRLPVYNQLERTNSASGNYILINTGVYIDSLDLKSMLDFVARGNQVFIAASSLSRNLTDTLGLSIGYDHNLKQFETKLLWSEEEPKYIFKSPLDNSYFDSLDCATTRVLGRKSNGKADFVHVKLGKGNIYLNTNPTAFSNYFVLSRTTGDYAFKCLSYLPKQNVIWDEYQKQGRIGEDDVFRVIMEYAPLKWAYYLMILGVVVFILFESKRRQRIIPIVKPLANNTLEFTKVVGALYFNSANHSDLAKKKVNYLLEFIRTHFFERTNEIDDEFIAHFTAKTGWNKEKMRELLEMVRWIDSLPENQHLHETDLIKLNNLIEEFYEFVKN